MAAPTKLFESGPGPPGASHGPSLIYKAYACQDDLQDVAHRTNTCATWPTNKSTYTAETADVHGQAMTCNGFRVDDDLHG